MKSLLGISLLCLISTFLIAQKDPSWGYINPNQADSIRQLIALETNDTLKMADFRLLGFYYQEIKPDSAVYFHEQQLELARKLNIKMWQADALSQAGYSLSILGNVMRAYEYFSEAMKLAANERNESSNWREWTFSNAENFRDARIAILGMNYQMMGNIWFDLGEPEKQIKYYLEGVKLGDSIHNGKIEFISYLSLSRFCTPDSAILYTKLGLQKAEASNYNRVAGGYLNLARFYFAKDMMDSVMIFLKKGKERSLEEADLRSLTFYYYMNSVFHHIKSSRDSCLFYANKTLETALLMGTPHELQLAYGGLASSYELNSQLDSAIKYVGLYYALTDSLKTFQVQNLKEFQKISFNEQLHLRKLQEEEKAYITKLKMIGLTAGLGSILIVSIILYRNNRQKQKTNKVLESTLTNLKATQSQLIQSEKMASLGELTAGIAHEIQNPLNFVNNFSEVNKELADELAEEIEKGNYNEAKALAKDIKDNQEKINQHGKRADGIVKGMLQHSRSNSGKKEPTDINALCDEYLRLSYHGLRAKNKSFNAKFETNFDAALPKVNVVPQEMGRVVLNLINNAFYAVSARASAKVDSHYQPTVIVNTKREGDKLLISVKDNGNGIPESIKEKIFQPFFTTKPTGQGTGLGLSLSYDIVKAHGGELSVESREGEGSTFIIGLPVV